MARVCRVAFKLIHNPADSGRVRVSNHRAYTYSARRRLDNVNISGYVSYSERVQRDWPRESRGERRTRSSDVWFSAAEGRPAALERRMDIQQRTLTVKKSMTIRPTTQPNIISPVACTQEGTPFFLTHGKKQSGQRRRRHRAAGDAALLSPSSTAECRFALLRPSRSDAVWRLSPSPWPSRSCSARSSQPPRGPATLWSWVRARGVAPPREEPPVLSSPNNHGGRATTSQEGK